MITFNRAAAYERLAPIVMRLQEKMPDLNFAIAGGAVRDLLMDRPVKDVDILVQQQTPLSSDQRMQLQAFFDTEFKEYDSESVENYDDEDRTEFPVAIYTGSGVDIIVVTNIFRYVDDFPDDISKALYSPKVGLNLRPGFEEAHDKQNITYRVSAGGDRLQRLLAKYNYSVLHVAGRE